MSRGDGRVFRRSGTRYWWMGYYVHGLHEQRSTRETDERRAKRVLKQRIAEVRAQVYNPIPRKLVLEDLLSLIKEDYAANRRRSVATLGFQCRHLLDYFGATCRTSEITTLKLDQYVATRRDAAAAASSIRGELSHLSRAFKLALRARLVAPSQVPYIPQVKPDPSRVRRGFLTSAELDRVCRLLDPDSADFVRFLFFSAWRPGEARNLEWRDYDRSGPAFRLRGEATKTGQPRLLPVAGQLRAIIERRLRHRRPDCRYVFHRHGRRIGRFRAAWRQACEEAGVGRRLFHDLRRSGIKNLVESGVDQRRAMAISGHRTVSTFHRYQIADLSSLREAMEMASVRAAPPNVGQEQLRRRRAR